MRRAHNTFLRLIDDINVSKVLFDYFDGAMRPPLDYSDILRWEWIQSVSALDKLIHDLVRIGMVEIFERRRSITSKYNSFVINLDTYIQMRDTPLLASYYFENQVSMKHRFLAFQDPDKISDALSYIWAEPHKWQAIASYMGKDEKYCIQS